MGQDLAIGLIASFIWFIIGYVFSRLLRFFNEIRPVKKLWAIKDPKNLIIVASTSTRTDTGEYERPATGIGQLRALGYTVESLSKAYDVRIKNILLSDDQVQKQIEKDVIILGGPKNNIIAKMYLNKILEQHLIANQTIKNIVWHGENGIKEYCGVKTDRKVVKDYGLIVRTKNPFSSESRKSSICIFTGCHTFGTIAAAKYFTNYYIKEIKPFSKIKNNLFLLVECDVIDGFPVAIKLIERNEF